MRDGWRDTTLGHVLNEIARPVQVANLHEVRFAGVRWYAEGVYPREPVPAVEVKTKALTELRPGDVTYNRMWATKASFGVAGEDVDGCHVTNDFPIFAVNTAQTTGGFVELFFSTPWFQSEAATRATGTTERRRLKQRDFLEIPIALPPLDEQRRIVDLIAAVDDAVDAAEVEANSLDAQLGLLRRHLFAEYEDLHVSDLVERIEGGRSVQAEGRPPGPGEIGVIKLSAVNERGFIASESKTLASADGFTDRMLIRKGDVLITRANTSERVGMTCLVDAVPDGLYLSDKTLRIVPRAGIEAQALVHALQSPRVRAQFSAFGTGTSASMQNISQRDIGRALTGWPTDARDQARVAATLSAHAASATAALATAESLRTLRSNLLTVFLSGEHEIPPSYDALLEEVA